MPERRGLAVCGERGERAVRTGSSCRHYTSEILLDHGQSAAGKIAQAIRQVAVVASQQSLVTETAILPENHLAQQEVAQSIHAQDIGDGLCQANVSARFGHLLAFKRPPAMRHHPLRERLVRSHQKRRPVDCVEAQNFLADQVQIGRPHLLKLKFVVAITHAAHVAGQRVVPDIDHVLVIVGPGDTPFYRCAADGKIAQPALHEGDHLVAARLRLNEGQARPVVQLEQTIGKCRKLEIIIFF